MNVFALGLCIFDSSAHVLYFFFVSLLSSFLPSSLFSLFSSYFTALAKGDVESFLEDEAKKKKAAEQAAAAAGQ